MYNSDPDLSKSEFGIPSPLLWTGPALSNGIGNHILSLRHLAGYPDKLNAVKTEE